MQAEIKTNSTSMDLEEFKECLIIIVEIISKPPRYILNKLRDITSSTKTENKSVNSNDINSQYDERELEEFNDNKIMLFKKMDNISGSLKSNENCYNEYFDFCEIKDMTQDILNRDISIITEADLDFILDLFKNFFRIIDYKFTLLKTDTFNAEEFKSKYNSYLTHFNNSKTYYYENICNDSIDNELFQQYSNIIMR